MLLPWKCLCGAGGQWRAALGIYESMDGQGLRQDAITCSSLISALAKGKQWALALQVPSQPRMFCLSEPMCVHTILRSPIDACCDTHFCFDSRSGHLANTSQLKERPTVLASVGGSLLRGYQISVPDR